MGLRLRGHIYTRSHRRISKAIRDVFTAHDSTLAGLYQSVLASAGISCFVRGYHDGYAGIAGIVRPTLCITNDADYERALELLSPARAGEAAARPGWICPECGEDVPGNFDFCWKCGEEHPA